MAKDRLSGKLAVILHADVAGSTELVQQDKKLAHERIQDSFQRFSDTIEKYQGHVVELRGDALLAEFEHVSDAVSAALSFQSDHAYQISRLKDDLRPTVRVGIAIGEVITADSTVTGAGVVQAQRIEQIADPGGVCVTAAIHEALSKRMPFDLENLGEQVLKGFDDPIRVYRVELSAGESVPPPEHDKQREVSPKKLNWIVAMMVVALVAVGGGYYWFKAQVSQEEPASAERMAYPLPDKPSIAVLPFSNLSDDKQQEYFADGMTEDLITDISKVSGLFVIARNSVFTYKGKAVKVRQVAEELGVRYVMEGSVRRVGNQVRINAQLIDATTGGHIWADRYDGSLNDVFSMQDKITSKIVTALEVTLTGTEQSNQAQGESNNSEAYDIFLRGWESYRRDTPEDYAKAVTYFEKAIELDPDYKRANSALAAVYWNSAWRYWVESFGLSTVQLHEQARIHLRKAMQSPSALTHQIASERAAFFDRKPDRALAEAEIAIAIDANDPAGHLAMANALLKANRPKEAVASMQLAMRHDPHYPGSYLTRLGRAQFAMDQYRQAADTLERSTGLNPEDDHAFVYLAAAYAHLGRKEEAKTAVKQANRLRAERRWGELYLEDISFWNWMGDRKSLREGLAIAGVKSGIAWISRVTRTVDGIRVEGPTEINIDKAKTLHESGIPFIDTSRMFIQGRIPGAHNLLWYRGVRGNLGPRELNEIRLMEIVDKSQGMVIYNSGGGGQYQAAQASAYAFELGFQNVYFFEDGLDKWKAAGYPVETGK
jgi:TolB-like protein/class 3 adenylate cyclase/Flp pilus assembly protein TadD/rhodanese-related sulfurtransferase